MKKPGRRAKPDKSGAQARTAETSARKPDIQAEKEGKEHKVIDALVGNLSLALEEDVGEIDEMLEDAAEKQPREYQNRVKKPAKYRFFLVFGLVMFWLAIIGALSVAETVRELIYDVTNQTALKEEFERFLFPVVVNDPPEFGGAENMPVSTVISSAIWQIILSGDTEIYERSLGRITIPENNVEAAARSIFGSGFEMIHRTVDNITIAFVYSEESKSYSVPENPAFFTFSPKVSEISSTGETYRLVVEYIAPSPYLIAGIEYEAQRVKTMIYTVIRASDGSKTIQSIELDRENEEFIHF